MEIKNNLINLEDYKNNYWLLPLSGWDGGDLQELEKREKETQMKKKTKIVVLELTTSLSNEDLAIELKYLISKGGNIELSQEPTVQETQAPKEEI